MAIPIMIPNIFDFVTRLAFASRASRRWNRLAGPAQGVEDGKGRANGALLLPAEFDPGLSNFDFVSVIAPPSASASMPSHTPAMLANGGSGHAHTINSCPARSACPGDLRDHAVRLVNRRHRRCLY